MVYKSKQVINTSQNLNKLLTMKNGDTKFKLQLKQVINIKEKTWEKILRNLFVLAKKCDIIFNLEGLI